MSLLNNLLKLNKSHLLKELKKSNYNSLIIEMENNSQDKASLINKINSLYADLSSVNNFILKNDLETKIIIRQNNNKVEKN